jgi:hypothetical protein
MENIYDYLAGDFYKFCKSKHIAWLQHPREFAPFLEFLIGYFKDKKEFRFLEVGVLHGANFKVIGEVMQMAGHDVSGLAVDLPNIDSKFGGVAGPDPIGNLKTLNISFPYNGIIGNSQEKEVVEKVRVFAPFDLAFIDGDHTIIGHMADKNNYEPMVKGLVAFHDIAEPEHEVYKNWPNIRQGYKYWEFTHTLHYGIGVIETK